jgi:hypothetical protein
MAFCLKIGDGLELRLLEERRAEACSWEIYADWADGTTKLETQVIYLLS